MLCAWKREEFSEKEVVSILEAFRIYCLRRRLVGLHAAENKNFPLLAGKLAELGAAEDKKEKMFEILSKQESNLRLPNDIELSRGLETMNFYNFAYCKFYLSLIEESITKSRPDQTDKKLQIEHIMPQNLNDDWKIELGENYEMIHQELVGVIGNLTLIRHNQELGQKKFADKKVVYEENAGLQIAKSKITNHRKWTEKTIKDRTKWLTGLLLDNVLPIPAHRRKINNYSAKKGRGLSFQELQLIGLDIDFIPDPSIHAHIVGDKEVEFEGKKWKLSPLTKELQTRRGKLNNSGSYQGAVWWEFDGIRLSDII